MLGLNRASLQGDVAFVDALKCFGCTVKEFPGCIEVDGSAILELSSSGVKKLGKLRGNQVLNMANISDTVQTLAAVALFADGPTRIVGVAHNRHKESDRIADLARELRRLGAEVEEHDDGLTIHPRELHPCVVQTYQDHRMAMSLSLVGLRLSGVQIANPQCTGQDVSTFLFGYASVVEEQSSQ